MKNSLVMHYKLICSDIDGTLLDVNRKLSSKTIESVKRIHPSIPFILVSSRMPKSIRLLQKELDAYDSPLIAYNGALIIGKHGKVINSIEIPFSITNQICTFLPDNSVHFSLYNQDEWLVPSIDYWAKREQNNTRVSPEVRPLSETLSLWKKNQKGAHKIMAMGKASELNQVESFIIKTFKDQVNIYRSKDTYLEISNKKTDKASALKYLLTNIYPHLKMNDVMAFGDNHNDKTMLEQVGLGIAVANAKSEILACTSIHTLTNHNHGVALAIQKYN